jgi:hypothetical protein
MGFGVRIGLGKRIGPFRAGVSVSHRGLGYGVGAGPFHLTGGTGRSSRAKSSSSSSGTGFSNSDTRVSSSYGIGCTGFSSRAREETSNLDWYGSANYQTYSLVKKITTQAEIEYVLFLILLVGSFPALLIFEFSSVFFLSGAPFVQSIFLAIKIAVVGVLGYGVLMLVPICLAQPHYPFMDGKSVLGNVNFFIKEDRYDDRRTWELLFGDPGTFTLKKFIYWASRPLNFWGVFFFQALPLLPVALAVLRIKGLKKLKADALAVIDGIEAQIEAQSELLESNGFPRVGTEGPRLLNEREKSLIDNSSKGSGNYFCACGYKRAKKHFFVECGVCRFAKNQASRK